MDFEPPDYTSWVNSNFRVPGPRMGKGKDSVTSTRRESTGTAPSSPSDTVLAAATALWVRNPHPSGTVMRQANPRDCFGGMSKLCSAAEPALLPAGIKFRSLSADCPETESVKLRRTLPDWG